MACTRRVCGLYLDDLDDVGAAVIKYHQVQQ